MQRQKIISIGIGLIVAIFVLIGGFMILQGRVGRASGESPAEFSCEGDRTQITVTYKSSSSQPGTLVYGTSAESLTFINDETGSPGSVSPGIFEHSHVITLLPAGTTHHIEVVGTDGTRYGDPATGSPYICATTESAQEAPPPGLEPTELPTAAPTQSETADDLTKVIEYYDTHPEATFADCVSSSDLDGILGLSRLCIAEYQKRQ